MDARKARDVGAGNMRRNIEVLRHAVKLEEVHATTCGSDGVSVGVERT